MVREVRELGFAPHWLRGAIRKESNLRVMPGDDFTPRHMTQSVPADQAAMMVDDVNRQLAERFWD